MFREGYFSQTTKGEKVACDLCKNLEANHYKETLFILDGLNEVYEGLDRDKYIFKLLRTLLDLPAIIVTSRPHDSLIPPKLRFDPEPETLTAFGHYFSNINFSKDILYRNPRTSNSLSEDSTYHFLHLTFQEYFAARYFVRRWKAGKLFLNKPSTELDIETFLANRKYDGRSSETSNLYSECESSMDTLDMNWTPQDTTGFIAI
ncbi:hypothetical protein F4680DRAFT_450407 [Xylaria scruposa]|nr:hypothetical protein F4680DRAFT_450407 [Xylaria scruposa]